MQGPRETWYTEEGHLISTLIVWFVFLFPSGLGLPCINPAMLNWDSLSNCTENYNQANTEDNNIIIKLFLPAGKMLQTTYIQCTISFNQESAPRTCIKKLQQAFESTCAICPELNYTDGSIREMNHLT